MPVLIAAISSSVDQLTRKPGEQRMLAAAGRRWMCMPGILVTSAALAGAATERVPTGTHAPVQDEVRRRAPR